MKQLKLDLKVETRWEHILSELNSKKVKPKNLPPPPEMPRIKNVLVKNTSCNACNCKGCAKT